ncbi:hypothetical protein QOT17_010338 [Balamuthia mandrillaris]
MEVLQDADDYGLCTHCDCFVRHHYWERHCKTTKHITNVKKSIREENARLSLVAYLVRLFYCSVRHQRLTIINLSTSLKQWLLHMFACAQQSSSFLLPPTAYLLDQVKASLLPPQFQLTGTVSAKKSQKTRSNKSTDEPLVEIEYQDILKVAEDLLNSADGDLHWTYEENEGTVEDRWHTKGWKQYKQLKRRKKSWQAVHPHHAFCVGGWNGADQEHQRDEHLPYHVQLGLEQALAEAPTPPPCPPPVRC